MTNEVSCDNKLKMNRLCSVVDHVFITVTNGMAEVDVVLNKVDFVDSSDGFTLHYQTSVISEGSLDELIHYMKCFCHLEDESRLIVNVRKI